MSCFLKLPNQSLIMVDYNSRSGLYYQIFEEDQVSRPKILLSNGTQEYTAFLDKENDLHVIAKNNRNQIIHVNESSNKVSKDIILDDHNNEFKIDNLYALPLGNEIHLFYYADHPSTKLSQLVYHVIKESLSTPLPLGNLANRKTNYDCIKYKNSILLGMNNKEDNNYSIIISSLDANTSEFSNLFTPTTSTFPITYCKLSVDKKGIYHLIYVQEKYGQYQLIYKNNSNSWSNESLIYSCGHSIKPVIFIYNGALWINWIENNTLKAILSVDDGMSFSKPITTSLQDANMGLHSYYASSMEDSSLVCNQLYGINYPTPKFAVLCSLDMDGIHSNMVPNTELKLYLANIKKHLNLSVTKSQLEEENQKLRNEVDELIQVQNDITSQYNELAALTKQIQSEGKKWRETYAQAKSEIEFYKKRNKQLEKSLESKSQNENPKDPSQEEISPSSDKKKVSQENLSSQE